MLKILTYISKINKNEKEMKKLNDTCMKNIKINFEEEENKIKYEEYLEFHLLKILNLKI